MPSRYIRDTNNVLVPKIPAGGYVDGSVLSADIGANTIVDADVATGVFASITGVGSQSQALDMGTNLIENVSNIATGTITDETNTQAVFTITDATGAVQLETGLTIADATDIVLNGTTGTKIGTATTQKIGFYNATPVVQPTALTTVETSVTFVDENTPDFALGSLKAHSDDTGAGFASLDEAQGFVEMCVNMQVRIGELETKLQALGLLA